MPAMSNETERTGWWVYASLVIAGLAAFWPSVWFEFVNWDDPAYVLHNELITSWSPSNLWGVATETVTRNYAPLTILSLLIDHTLWGMNPGGYHATNVLLHIVNGLLVFVLVRQLTGKQFVAWVTAALFLVHPVQIETVAWISSRKGLLSASFMLAALIARLKPEPDAKSDGWYAVWLAAALLSKALAVVVPAIVLAWDVWVRRQKFADAFVRQVIPGVMCLLLLFKTMAAQHSILGGVRGHLDYSVWRIMAIDTTIMWRYIGMLFWPTDLCVLYDPPTSGIWKMVGLATAGWLVIGALIHRSRTNAPIILWAATAWLVLLLPVLNFFKITTLMNDRYLYLPCIIIFALVAAGLQKLLLMVDDRGDSVLRHLATSTKWAVGLTAVCAALMATSRHLPVWRNPDSLWAHAMTKVPQLPVVRIQMALTCYDKGQRQEAIRTLQRALLECDPDDLDRQRMTSAIESWSEELQTRSADASPVNRR
jgi:protein O-mannosyl-transferase